MYVLGGSAEPALCWARKGRKPKVGWIARTVRVAYGEIGANRTRGVSLELRAKESESLLEVQDPGTQVSASRERASAD